MNKHKRAILFLWYTFICFATSSGLLIAAESKNNDNVTTFINSHQSSQKKCNLQKITAANDKLRVHIDDISSILKHYRVEQIDPVTKKQVNWHPGNTFEHSAWSEKAVELWFDKNDVWVVGLDRKTASVAAFLHDIGKAGDLEYWYLWKENHPTDGFKELLDHKDFLFVDNKNFERIKQKVYAKAPTQDDPTPKVLLPKDIKIDEFDFTTWFKKNGIAPDKQKKIAIATGIHYKFGLVLNQIKQIENKKINLSKESVYRQFLDDLTKLTKEANYNNGVITEELVQLAIMIGAADLKGTDLVVHHSKMVDLPDNIPIPKHKIHFKNNAPYDVFLLESKGKQVRKELLNYFKSSYEPYIQSRNGHDNSHFFKM